LYLPLTFFTNERKGDLMARFGTDVQEIQFSILRSLETFVRAPIAIIGSLVVMIYISPTLTLFSFVLMLVVGLLIGRLGKSLKRNSAEAQSLLGRLFNILEETLGGMRILRAFGAEEYQSRHFSQLNGQHYDLQTRIQRRKDLSSPLTEFLGIAIIAVLLLFGGHLVFEGYFEPSTFVVFIMMFYNIIEPAKSFSSAFYDIQRGTAAAERIADILNQEMQLEQDKHKVKALVQHLPPTLDIAYQNVSFAYPNTEQQVLHHISLQIPFGTTVAIVGTSGSGKSTLVDLLPRFYEPTEGAIMLGEHNIKDFDMAMLRSCFGIVSQDAILFNDTVANNIALGLADTPREDIIKAAQLAAAHDFISALPEGYDSNIGERGGKLSGGQRQRIALARAILRRPPVLILDEATSALDSESEKLIQDALAELRQNRTVIIIAHRFSTIQAADQIVVMQKGEIVEIGNHQELMQQQGEYYKFHGLQSLG
jgi:ABC-type multidrug transport system fused ATPase/permease subunit